MMRSKEGFPQLNTKQPDGFKPNGQPYRAFIVEDKDFHRKQIEQILESEGYDVVDTATNGREALDKLGVLEKPVDFITTSLDMPVIDGYALLHELNQKKDRPIIIFISEDTSKGVMKDLISMGIADFILKPLNRRTILERISIAIKKQK